MMNKEGLFSPKISTLGLKIKILSCLTQALSEGRVPPKGTGKPDSLTSFPTSRIAGRYFSMAFSVSLLLLMEEAKAGSSFSSTSTTPRRGCEGGRGEAPKRNRKGERQRNPSQWALPGDPGAGWMAVAAAATEPSGLWLCFLFLSVS